MAYDSATKTFTRGMRFETDPDTENGDIIRQVDVDRGIDDLVTGMNAMAADISGDTDAALTQAVNATIFTNTTLGLAATTDSQTFMVQEDIGVRLYTRVDASTATPSDWIGRISFANLSDFFGTSQTGFATDQLLHVEDVGFVYKVAASGATDHDITVAGTKLYALPISGGWFMPDQFSENVTPGTTNMTGAVIAAKEKGMVKGSGAVYAVNGAVTLAAGNHLEDIHLKQLSPGSATAVTLSSNAVNNLTLRRVTVDRNGDGTNGGNTEDGNVNWALNTAFGISIVGGTGHILEDLEVFGDDSGSLIKFQSLDHTTQIIRPKAHTAYCTRGVIADDVIQGIFFYLCTGITVESPMVYDLQTQPTAGATTTLKTRGVVEGGCVDMTYQGISIDSVDQAFDSTGSDGNIRTRVLGGTVRNCYTNGVKFANSAVEFICDSVTCYRAGENAFLASGPSGPGLPNLTRNGVFVNCRAVETGSNGAFATSYAFRNVRQPDDRFCPEGTRFVDCIADCGAGVTSYAFHNLNEPRQGDMPVEVIRPVIIGTPSVGRYSGIHRNIVKVRGSAAQSIPDSVKTTLTFDVGIIDDLAAHDPVTNNDKVYAWRDGRYKVSLDPVYWAGNANGVREIRFQLDGADLGLVNIRYVPESAGDVFFQASYTTERILKGQYLSATVLQTSGGNLDVNKTVTEFNVEWMGD